MRHILLIISLVIFKLNALSVNNRPVMARACFNNQDSVITISWRNITDACGSFTSYKIYGQEDNDPYILIDVISNINITEYPYKLPDFNSDRRFYITVDHACDNTTILHSDTIDVDKERPTKIEIDSVSIDVATQKTVVGWTQNPAIDKWFYSLYDYSSGDRDSVTSTLLTIDTISNTRAGRYPIVLSTTDSCSLNSVRSEPHMTTLLRGTLDKCARKINLTWQLYRGWSSIDSQQLYVSIDGRPFVRDTTLDGAVVARTISHIVLGQNYSYYIRSFRGGSMVTSSSNTVTIATTQIMYPSDLNLSLATVYHSDFKQAATPSIMWELSSSGDISKFNIFRGTNKNNMLNVRSVPFDPAKTNYYFDDLTVDARDRSYIYLVQAVDDCDTILAETNSASTIHLDISDLLVHNEYINWENGVREYRLTKEGNSSTWNIINTYNSPSEYFFVDFSDSSGCYQVIAEEEENSQGVVSLSKSNIFCISKDLVFDVTTGVNSTSDNNSFKIIGEGINHDKSYYQIYNRWGQLIVSNPSNIPWTPNTENDNTPVGSYIYVGELIGEKGERASIKGVVHVIR